MLQGKYVPQPNNTHNLHLKLTVIDWLNRKVNSVEHVFTNQQVRPIEWILKRTRNVYDFYKINQDTV